MPSGAIVREITPRHQVAARMRQAILGGALRSGERIAERALAARFGATVNAVRDAVIQLESEGLVTRRSKSATHITSLSEEDIAQTFAVRISLERLAVGEAAVRATPADIRNLATLRAAAVEAAERRDPRLYVRRDFAWHEAVWAASRNEVLASTLRRLVLPLFGFSIIQVVSAPTFDLIEDARLHSPILAAIGRHDRDAATRAFEAAFADWTTHVREQSEPGAGIE